MPLLAFPVELRKIVYTTNAIELERPLPKSCSTARAAMNVCYLVATNHDCSRNPDGGSRLRLGREPRCAVAEAEVAGIDVGEDVATPQTGIGDERGKLGLVFVRLDHVVDA